MKTYVLKDANSSSSGKDLFLTGLVFGFDVGTGSIGYAVRNGADFKDVGVLICDSEGSDLSKRRDLRRQRRTLRSKKYRRQWFAKELIKLGLPKPQMLLDNPISLRLRALNGEELKPEELHAALTHLFKRRGYSKVPWANVEKVAKQNAKPKKDDEEGVIKKAVEEIKIKLGDKHPCQFLAERRSEIGKSPTTNWARKIYWPREVLQNEFEAIVTAQKKNLPKLAEKSDWLLYGDSQPKKKGEETFHVFFKTTEARNPGVLGLRWPRFDNRGPALDSLQPVDEQGRPLHVVRKNKEAFTKAQWELAVLNFRVIDQISGKVVVPDAKAMARLREMWESRRRKSKGKTKEGSSAGNETKVVEIRVALLEKWAREFASCYKLVEGQQPLTPLTGAGRARYSSLTLERIVAGERFNPPQPLLRRKGESVEQALNRYLAEIKHPLVRHRLILFSRVLRELIYGAKEKKGYGIPDVIVLEAVRSLALSKDHKQELIQRNKKNRDERTFIRGELTENNQSTSRNAILRYRLWKEAGSTCPFCCQKITQEELFNGAADIEHIVPRAIVDCNEFYNLTIGHIRCNRELKGDQIPYRAFSQTEKWPQIKDNAERCFKRTRVNKDYTKADLFLSQNAEELIEQKADLQHTAYIARVIRHIALIQLDWLGDDGRDPTIEKGNKPSSAFQVTNGQITHRLRKAWGLNQILNPFPPKDVWDAMTPEEQAKKKAEVQEKNRGDLRHHALDAMVIACTLPWLAHRTHGAKDLLGRHGWWTQDEKQRSKAANPLFPNEGQMHEVVKKEIEKVVVRHHVSRSNHQRTYDTTIYGRPKPNGVPIPDCYVSREPITALKPADLKSPKTGKSKVFPSELGDYLALAWESYCETEPEWEKQIKANKNCLPEAFQKRLCFSAFQQWRADGAPAFFWPKKIKIPIKRVGYIGVEDDSAVAPASPGTNGFVARGSFREVRLHPSEDGKSLVPVFVPLWRLDKPIPKAPIKANSKPVATIRRGQTVEIKNSPGRNTPVGKYRVASTMQQNIKLLPVHLADIKESLKASGFLENGVNISWDTFIKSVGYELPHPSSVKPQSPGAAEA